MYRHEKIYNPGSMVRTSVACSHCHLKAGLEPRPQCKYPFSKSVCTASTLMKHGT